MKYGAKLESIGVKLPKNKLSTKAIEKQLNSSRLSKLELLSGISNRRICGENEDSLTLAVDAINDCLKYSDLKANQIEMIICCSISKYVNGLNHCYEPALSLLIKNKIGNTSALNFDVSNACAGMITGIHIANNFISMGQVKNCLVVSGEFISILGKNALKNVDSMQHPELASLTIGDAGAAVILTQACNYEESIQVSELNSFAQFSELCMGYQNTNFPGGTMLTDMKKIHEVSLEKAPLAVESALKLAKLTLSEIDFLIPHQTSKISICVGARMLTRYFGEKPGEVVVNLDDTGNTASTTHLTTLYKLLCKKKFKVGDRILLLSFASGLVIGTVIFSMNDIVLRYGNDN